MRAWSLLERESEWIRNTAGWEVGDIGVIFCTGSAICSTQLNLSTVGLKPPLNARAAILAETRRYAKREDGDRLLEGGHRSVCVVVRQEPFL